MVPLPSVRVLSLSAKVDGSSTLYRLRQGTILQFRLSPGLLGCKIDVFSNHPSPEESPGDFERERFRRLEWRHDSDNTQDDTAAFIDLALVSSGSFRYYFSCSSEDVGGSGYFLVDPELKIGSTGESLPLDCIQCQTVLSKNLGEFPTWESKLRVAKESGFNMIHFTPVQALGDSNSAYSLADQHSLNVTFHTDWKNVETLVRKMDSDWGVLSICDIVLNHTANETNWLSQHPEATYNCSNSPHLRPAFMLDRVLFHLSLDIEQGMWNSKGIPTGKVSTEEHLSAVRALLYDHYFPKVNMYEFFLMDIPEVLDQFEKRILSTDPPVGGGGSSGGCAGGEQLKLIPDTQYRRLKATVDLDLAMRLYNVPRAECSTEENRILVCCSELKKTLDQLNHAAYNEAWSHLNAAVENIIKGARYFRVQPDGPRDTACGEKQPFICQYFTGPPTSPRASLQEEESMMFSKSGEEFMAHNGWVMDIDPLVNFALPGSNVYFRREMVAWGDSVKLRFGMKPEDSPFLWQFYKEYAEQTARIFHGIRLDNCHSTPIHVAEYMLDAARRVRPNLYVIAELFTRSEGNDNVFINRLGISSLIREALSACNAHEEGRLVHRFGGEPVGSFLQPRHRPLVPAMAHALLFDQTHDNESPIDKRSLHDFLPTAALVSMASCACGSNRGYDELVPHHIHVVNESRTYGAWGNGVHPETGMVRARKQLNDLHHFLGKNGFGEVYVDQMDPDIVAVTRHRPDTHESFVLVSHTVFSKGTNADACRPVKPLYLEGQLVEVVLEAKLVKQKQQAGGADQGEFRKDPVVINGLQGYTVETADHIDIGRSTMARIGHSGSHLHTNIELHHFPPGSVIIFRFRLHESQSSAAQAVRTAISELTSSPLPPIIADLSLLDIQHALFKCDTEERASSGGNRGVYVLDGFGPLPYAGIQGVMCILNEIRPKNDLGNWLPGNLRSGDWMMDFLIGRLKDNSGTRSIGEWLERKAFEPLKKVPRYLIPRYFDAVVTAFYVGILERTWSLMSPFVQNGSSFCKALAMGSVQHTAVAIDAPLPALSPKLAPPAPAIMDGRQMAPTIAAGLPHFSTGYMRSWGRDTFIALRGLLLLTGRYQDARYIILAYAGCLRHGLIPNLLDGGKNARFNCRDATWWWLHCILSYVAEAPQGERILQDKVSRLYPNDDANFTPAGECDQTLEAVIHEALQKHFQGLKFRERNAGGRIDEHMTDEGFNNEIGVRADTGFVFGGNVNNCGTWMDKMGSSGKAGIKGRPATPRDGSAVEIVGLSYACLKGLAQLNASGLFCYNAVERVTADGSFVKWTLSEWSEKICASFEKYFHVSRDNRDEVRPDLINKSDIYKDTLGSGQPWADYQLRCNFPITMAVAPELFQPQHAWTALQVVRAKLLGPLGIATLDPDDWAYRGDYDNSNDSEDASVSHGFNYHQGPEWVWPVGFFLRAYLHFAEATGGAARYGEARDFAMAVLSSHFIELQQSKWSGIPELTNSAGKFCPDSNPIQAWSMSCLLEVLHDLEKKAK